MRLIGTVKTETLASHFSDFLQQQGIENLYEIFTDPQTGEKYYRIWIVDEDSFPKAEEFFTQFQNDPQNPLFKARKRVVVEPASISREEPSPGMGGRRGSQVHFNLKKRVSAPLTNFFLILCVFLFFWNGIEEEDTLKGREEGSVQLVMTPIMQELLFDYPHAYELLQQFIESYPLQSLDDLKTLPPEAKSLYQEAENTPYWRGIYDLILHHRPSGPLFEKIRKGEIWRFFTPILLHRDFLHILFNMSWLWVLGRQIEERVRRWKMVFLILVIALISNTAQYLMSGPYFLGFSGVVVGMAAFIWMRQRITPWEGYPLKRSTFVFIAMFVLAMFALELVTFLLQLAGMLEAAPAIANTAHLVGGFAGAILARIPFFARAQA